MESHKNLGQGSQSLGSEGPNKVRSVKLLWELAPDLPSPGPCQLVVSATAAPSYLTVFPSLSALLLTDWNLA